MLQPHRDISQTAAANDIRSSDKPIADNTKKTTLSRKELRGTPDQCSFPQLHLNSLRNCPRKSASFLR
jgi:hypothetical protein